MSEFLAKVPRFAFEAEETFDEIPDGQPKMEMTNLRRLAVERPNHAASDATGDTLNRASWYDGQTVTVLDKENNVYAVIEAGGTLDATLTSSRTTTGRTAAGGIMFSIPTPRLWGRTTGASWASQQPASPASPGSRRRQSKAVGSSGDSPPRKRSQRCKEPGEPQSRHDPALEPGPKLPRPIHVRAPRAPEDRREGGITAGRRGQPVTKLSDIGR